MNAVIVPCVTCELPTKHVPLNQEWEHVKGLKLADPDFGKPGKVDLLLGVETFERMMHSKGQFEEVDKVVDEYFENKHAKPVPQADLMKPPNEVFYLPIHVVRKESSATTKVRAVFDASAKTSTGIPLNDTLLVGPTVHPPLVDVLIRFRCYRIALIADVSRMYRAIYLTKEDKDLHRFVWRRNTTAPLLNFRMTRVTFGVSSSWVSPIINNVMGHN